MCVYWGNCFKNVEKELNDVLEKIKKEKIKDKYCTYTEALYELNKGNIIKNEVCMYIKPNEESNVYWKWIGEETWTKGDKNIEEVVQSRERVMKYEIIRTDEINYI